MTHAQYDFLILKKKQSKLCFDVYVWKLLVVISALVILCVIGSKIITPRIPFGILRLIDKNLTTGSYLKSDDDNRTSVHKINVLVSSNNSSAPTLSNNNESMSRTNENQTRTDHPDLCKDASFDAILSYKNDIFVLKGDWYWKLSNNGIDPKYPKLISQKWSGLPGNIDTAFTDYDDKYTYFFKGSQYWKFNGEKLEYGFPKDIRTDFPNVPDNLQVSSMGNREIGELYFFKGNIYWIVDMNKTPYQMKTAYSIINWPGIPFNLDAALRSTDFITYFFKGDRYYKYTEKTNQVVRDDPPYPRSTASNWFGCHKS